ncbi:MAG: 16S rRNA (uracil(1498)-N(3))-methyltransferase [Lachnospiraceae bacterium]|nr:16S rRNA (uracil(1498)-N(3))-methyltransferase [Lachnospiraceae bacterium]
MHRFFTERIENEEEPVLITGSDYNHMKNVLRLREGEEVTGSDGTRSFLCRIERFLDSAAELSIAETLPEDRELPAKIILFQGLPKSDKMETVIQKAVELGASKIVPVAMARSVVKLDEKKAASRKARWQTIAESAAKQSGRLIVPEVGDACSFRDAVHEASSADLFLLPYECETGSEATDKKLRSVKGCESIAVMIGPEGGFEKDEVDEAVKSGAETITLGKRILRTETAGPAMLAMLVYLLEIHSES